MNKRILTEKKVQVSTLGFQTEILPELSEYSDDVLQASTSDSDIHGISRQEGDSYKILWCFDPPQPDRIVTLKVCVGTEEAEQKVEEVESQVEDDPVEVAQEATSAFAEAKKPDLLPVPERKSVLSDFFRRQEKRVKVYNSVVKIRAQKLDHPPLENENILMFGASGCWARGLGMIQKAKQWEFELGTQPLDTHYKRIIAQGDGAIIGTAIAAGISLDHLKHWWLTDWRKAHQPGFASKVKRFAVSVVKPYLSGFDPKKARNALKKLFLNGKLPLRMKDVRTELSIDVIQADKTVTRHYSEDKTGHAQDKELWLVCEDTVVTKMAYAQNKAPDTGGIFLGAVEPNDVMGLLLSENVAKIRLVLIDIPDPIDPVEASKLGRHGAEADKVVWSEAAHYLYRKRVEQLIKFMKKHKIDGEYNLLECLPINHIMINDTSPSAEIAGIGSGMGKILSETELPKEENALISS